MKLSKIFKLGIVSMAFVATATSCNDWLQVDTEDSIMEGLLYENDEGYMSALNGIYSEMNELYGSTLSMGMLDVMAQYYNVEANSNHSFYNSAAFKYDQAGFKSTSNSVWTSLYLYIANINTLLSHCDDSDSKLSKLYRPYVKGEALALRAFFHFDLLRLYGPIYSAETENTIVMPYQETTSKEIQPLLSAKDVAAKIMRDLNEAEELLKDDRIRKDGVMNGDSDDPNDKTAFRYRNFRFNYYAVKALKARLYLWLGDKENAYNEATSIIKLNKEEGVFPWTKKNAVTSTSNPDLVFSSEVIFSLYNQSRKTLYDGMFSSKGEVNNMLVFKGSSMEDGNLFSKLTYFYDDFGDLRRNNQWSVETIKVKSDKEGEEDKKEDILCFNKYKDVQASSFRYMIPLIRLSEVYLIAAECAKTNEEALGYINDIRTARNCVKLELKDGQGDDAVQDYIYREFMREEIGEGQMFFFYKRKAMKQMMSGTEFGQEGSYWNPEDKPLEGQYKMDVNKYVWPLPEVEANKRLVSK